MLIRVLPPIAVGLSAALLSGCGDTGSVGPSVSTSPERREQATHLTLIAVNPYVGRARYELRCDPPDGDVPDPVGACAELAANPTLVTQPEPSICRGGPFSHWELELSGRFRGQPVNTQVSTCWTPQMALIRRLGFGGGPPPRLLPRRTRRLADGERATYPSGELRPGDLVTCLAQGKRLEAGVGFPAPGPSRVGWDPHPSVWLTVETREDGSVHAECNTPQATP